MMMIKDEQYHHKKIGLQHGAAQQRWTHMINITLWSMTVLSGHEWKYVIFPGLANSSERKGLPREWLSYWVGRSKFNLSRDTKNWWLSSKEYDWIFAGIFLLLLQHHHQEGDELILDLCSSISQNGVLAVLSATQLSWHFAHSNCSIAHLYR